jgi:hypothetical protein
VPISILSNTFDVNRSSVMQDRVCGFRRIYLPRTWVNKGKKEGQHTMSPGPLEKLSAYPEGWSMTPSCCIMPSRSGAGHSSTILPPSMRLMLMFVISTSLPVGGIPQSSP